MCVSTSPMLIWVLQWSQCSKKHVAQHWGGRGHISVRPKVSRVWWPKAAMRKFPHFYQFPHQSFQFQLRVASSQKGITQKGIMQRGITHCASAWCLSACWLYVLPLSIMPFTVLPFSSWYLYESGFFSVSFLYCGLEPIVGIFFVSSLQLKNIIIYNHTYFSQTHYYIWVNTLFFPTDNLASFLVFLWICLETRCLPGHFHSQVAWQNTELFLPIVVHSLRR